MTFVQLEYIVAVDSYRHFATAAGYCFVTQPTLSMQVHKLEEELGLKIFDRSKQPVIPTEAGREIIEQARRILSEKQVIGELVAAKKGILTGELRVGILVTPLQENGIREHVLFYEELLVYVSQKNAAYKKTYMLAKDIDPGKLWLLEEGHCFRSQIVKLCELRKASKEGSHFDYEAGSLETLRRMVELNDGITILPELAVRDLTGKQQRLIRHFRRPAPMREVSLVIHRDFVKQRLVQALRQEILNAVPEKVRQNKNQRVVPI